jgi:hypothetical protein
MRRWLVPALLAFGCSSEPEVAESASPLEWVTPDEASPVPMGDAIELAVASDDPAVASVRFALDGNDLATCDPSQPDEDCAIDDVFRWTTVFSRPGDHEIEATALDDAGNEVASVTRALHVVTALPLDEVDDARTLGETLESDDGPDELPVLAAAGRGTLDIDRPWHRAFGGIAWRVVNQRVRLHTGTPTGQVSYVRACMNRFGASIRHWADHYNMSRASVVATALAESTCGNPAGSSDGLSSGPMQVTASTCASMSGYSRSTCRWRMHAHPDFSFQMGVKYMSSSWQRSQHHRDPPKIAAAYNAGSLHASWANRWHMLTTGNHIDRWVRWYNAYRVWESQ